MNFIKNNIIETVVGAGIVLNNLWYHFLSDQTVQQLVVTCSFTVGAIVVYYGEKLLSSRGE